MLGCWFRGSCKGKESEKVQLQTAHTYSATCDTCCLPNRGGCTLSCHVMFYKSIFILIGYILIEIDHSPESASRFLGHLFLETLRKQKMKCDIPEQQTNTPHVKFAMNNNA